MTTTPGTFVRVWTDVGSKTPVPLLARIIEKDGIILIIQYLSKEKDGVWRYEDDTYEVENCPESIAEYLDTDREEDVGFVPHADGFMKMESDEDYIPDSDEEEETDEEEYEEMEEPEEEPDSSDSEESLEEY
jgi:hypothetical protein